MLSICMQVFTKGEDNSQESVKLPGCECSHLKKDLLFLSIANYDDHISTC